MGEVKTIVDPVHGTMKFDGVLAELLQAPEMVRLNQIKQLGLAYLVFPGAMHTRFEHSMGVCFVAGLMARELGLPKDEVTLLRASGLLHDLGHGPFSHTLEGIFHERIGLDHMQLTSDLIEGKRSLDLSGWLDPAFGASSVPELLQKHGLDPSLIASLVCQERTPGTMHPALRSDDAGPDLPAYMGQIIHSALDADQLDFLLRDSHYTGVAHGTIDLNRIVQTMMLSDGRIIFHKKGIPALEGMLVARSLMYSSVYFHKTARIAESMLCRAVASLPDRRLSELWSLSDAEALYELRDEEGVPGEIARRLRMRRLYKSAFRIESEDASPEDATGQEIRDLVRAASSPRERSRMEARIARRASIPEGSIIIDVPDPALTMSEPRIHRTDVLVAADKPVPLSKLSTIARALQHRPTVPWCLMVCCPPDKAHEVSKVAKRVLFER
jgi:HD superfamily phosphohydrolase